MEIEQTVEVKRGTRFSGADWADQLHDITLVGVGGIGSWLAINLARIGHNLILIDPDSVDQTNVTGGQAYRTEDIDDSKVGAIRSLCRAFGSSSIINVLAERFAEDLDALSPITITGLDNMAARKQVYKAWKGTYADLTPEVVFIDGRLTMEMYEIFTVRTLEEKAVYEKYCLFSDEEAQVLDCTTKQSTFAAMGIAAEITATLCNHLTNVKIGETFRDVPFYQRKYYPGMLVKTMTAAEMAAAQQSNEVAQEVKTEALCQTT